MTLTGKLFRDAVISGANNIANNRAAVDELNVFPVPDGDTGTNMSMTIGNALPELKAAGDGISARRRRKADCLRNAEGRARKLRRYSVAYFPRTFKGPRRSGGGGRKNAVRRVQAGR